MAYSCYSCDSFKIMKIKTRCVLTAALLAQSLMLGGCTGDIVALDSAQHNAMLRQDQLAEVFPHNTLTLTLTEALDRAVQVNLDAQTAAIEVLAQQGNVTMAQLNALPSLTGSRGFTRRNNNGASSSVSVRSGLESLEPSQSSDRLRRVGELKTDWNLLDAVLALSEAKSAQDETRVTRERYNKVMQNIERDVYAAFWRAYAFQSTRGTTEDLVRQLRTHQDNLSVANDKNLLSTDDAAEKYALLGDRERSLTDLHNNLSLSLSELKGLLSIPQGASLVLKAPEKSTAAAQRLLRANTVDQEWAALSSRPEMREEVLQKNIAVRKIREEVFKSFPGASILFSYNSDSNSFLQESEWTNLSGNIVGNLLNIFTLPFRYQAEEEKANLADARRVALNAAILAQVHIAKTRLANVSEVYFDSQRVARMGQERAKALSAKKKVGFASGTDTLLARMDAHMATMRAQATYADYQDSYAAMVNAMGQRLDHQTFAAVKQEGGAP